MLRIVLGNISLCLLVACNGGGADLHPANGNPNTSNGGNPNTSNGGNPNGSGNNGMAHPVLSITAGIKQLHFTWPAVRNATHYKVYRNVDGASGFTQVNGNITSTFYDQAIAVHRLNWPAARYFLEACNSAGCTASSEAGIRDAMLRAIGYFKASNSGANDLFGRSVGLSSDGNTLAVGAMGKDNGAGAVYIFTRQNGAWSQQAYLKAADAAGGDAFGGSLALSGDGNTLAAGAYLEDSSSTGINGPPGGIAENSANRGAVYIFTRNNGAWTQQAYVKPGSSHDNAYFGGAVSLNGNGDVLAAGATGERTGGMDAGGVYVFMRSNGAWSQQAFVKPSIVLPNAHFGASVALSGDGGTLAAGAPDEYNGSNSGGSVYVFTLISSAWSQQAAVKASNSAAFDAFGSVVALSGDGNSLAVGARNEKSAATGINGDQTALNTPNAGAVYVFGHNASAWSQQAYIKASNTAANAFFGGSLALSEDGATLAAGASGEAGIGDSQIGGGNSNSGAVYVFSRGSGVWYQQSYVKASNAGADDLFGSSIALSGDGDTLAAGATGEAGAATGINGNQADNTAANAGAVYLY